MRAWLIPIGSTRRYIVGGEGPIILERAPCSLITGSLNIKLISLRRTLRNLLFAALRDAHTAAMEQHPPQDINLLSLNCWGIRHISSLRQPRITQIGRLLASSSSSPTSTSPSTSSSPPLQRPDIVCLQELFTQQDYHTLRHETRHILPHGKFFHAGPFGAGLVILSRWPIEESSTYPYPLNGRPTAFWRGDWYVGKGIARARVRFGPHPQRDVVDVFNTHTHSPYESAPDLDDNAYACHRLSQAWELAKLVRAAAREGGLVVALGDFNMLPRSLAHRLITSQAPLRDVWRVLHPESALGPHSHPAEEARGVPVPSAEFNLTQNGATSNNVLNTWRWDKAQLKKLNSGQPCDVDPSTPDPRAQRLDYIFTSTGQVASHTSQVSPGWVVKSSSVTLTDRHAELGVSLSDHFAVQATITHHTPLDTPTADTSTTRTVPDSDFDAQLRYQHTNCDILPLSAYDEIIALTRKYTAREFKERRWRGIHFHVSLIVWVGCLVGIWFTPKAYASFILMLAGSLNLVAGTINGLLALLFFNSELRALKEFEWEIENAKALASGELTVSTEGSHNGKKTSSDD